MLMTGKSRYPKLFWSDHVVFYAHYILLKWKRNLDIPQGFRFPISKCHRVRYNTSIFMLMETS